VLLGILLEMNDSSERKWGKSRGNTVNLSSEKLKIVYFLSKLI
jgi:hypothetical protein